MFRVKGQSLQCPLFFLRILSFLFFLGTFVSLESRTEAALAVLPTPSEFATQFKATQNENQRFQLFNDLDSKADGIVDSPEIRKYLEVILEMMNYSQSLNDSSWVFGKGKELRQKISSIKVSRFVNSQNVIPSNAADRTEFIFYFLMSSEQTQFNYLSQSAPSAIISHQELNYLKVAYAFLSDIQKELNTSIDYIANSLRTNLFTIAHLVSRQYKILEFEELKVWYLRMHSEGYSKLLELMEGELYPGPQQPTPLLQKVSLSFQFIHGILYEKYKMDPFNEWQFNRPLQLLKTLILKYESNNWPIDRNAILYALQNSPNPSMVAFADALSDNVIRRENLTQKQGRDLLPAFEVLKKALEERGLTSTYFKTAYSLLIRSQMQLDQIEGRYKINHPFFQRLILLNKNGRTLSVGINRDDRNVSILFENIDDVDLKTGEYVTDVTAGDAHYTLRFKITKPGFITGCLSHECFTGQRVERFPHFISKLEKEVGELPPGKTVAVRGSYTGVAKMYSGKNNMKGTLDIDVSHGKYMGGVRMTNGIFMAFGDGIQENNQGVVYISGPAYSVRALHQMRGFINSKGQFEGVWLSTNIGKVADIVFTKVKK